MFRVQTERSILCTVDSSSLKDLGWNEVQPEK